MNFRIHHIALSVTDLELTTRFYEKFWFIAKYHWSAEDSSQKIRNLVLGDILLELFRFEQRLPSPESSHLLETDLPVTWIKHFALQVDSIEDAKMFCIEHNIPLARDITVGKTWVKYLFTRDPDGTLLELTEDSRNLTT